MPCSIVDITRQQFTLVDIKKNDVRVPDSELGEKIQAELESKKVLLVAIIAAM